MCPSLGALYEGAERTCAAETLLGLYPFLDMRRRCKRFLWEGTDDRAGLDCLKFSEKSFTCGTKADVGLSIQEASMSGQ